jgi:hypothetical protein
MVKQNSALVGLLLATLLISASVAEAEVCSLSSSGSTCADFAGVSWPNSAKATVSVDKLRTFLAPVTGAGASSGSDAGKLTDLTGIYALDIGGSNWLHLNYDLGAGSGSANMLIYVPGTHAAVNLGVNGVIGSAPTDANAVPEPAGLLLLGSAIVVARRLRRRRG